MGTLVYYVAHPIGADGTVRTANLWRAKRWLRWLIAERPDLGFAIPWLAYCEVLDESPDNRARGIRDDLEVLRRLDGIVLVGGRLSPGMEAELGVARGVGLHVLDLLHLGDEPPETHGVS